MDDKLLERKYVRSGKSESSSPEKLDGAGAGSSFRLLRLNNSDLVFLLWAGAIPRVDPPPAEVLQAVVAEVEAHPPSVDPTEQYKTAMRRRLNQKTAPSDGSGATNGTMP